MSTKQSLGHSRNPQSVCTDESIKAGIDKSISTKRVTSTSSVAGASKEVFEVTTVVVIASATDGWGTSIVLEGWGTYVSLTIFMSSEPLEHKLAHHLAHLWFIQQQP